MVMVMMMMMMMTEMMMKLTFTPAKVNVRYGSMRSLVSPDVNTFLTPSKKLGSTATHGHR